MAPSSMQKRNLLRPSVAVIWLHCFIKSIIYSSRARFRILCNSSIAQNDGIDYLATLNTALSCKLRFADAEQ